ncbi:hypothetical protein RPALISO_200 [Ruegeria phage RpAliso]|nr:hypothetical protein RPALISO_200 [Ruegeria phage RpAliso]
MLLLEAGYGAGDGPGLTLICGSRDVHPDMERVLLGYSCYPLALGKIRACLEASGRYDCWVQDGWIAAHQRTMTEFLMEIGIEAYVTSKTSICAGEVVVTGIPADAGTRAKTPSHRVIEEHTLPDFAMANLEAYCRRDAEFSVLLNRLKEEDEAHA